MNMQVINRSKPTGGFRELTADEILMVSGGDGEEGGEGEDIVVTGTRTTILTNVAALSISFDYGYGYGFGGGGGGGGETTERVFDPNADHCTAVPDSILGTYVGGACFNHDNNYDRDSTIDRAEADLIFFAELTALLFADGHSLIVSVGAASAYFNGVRLLGESRYEGQGSPE